MWFSNFFQKRRNQMQEAATHLGMDFQNRDEYGLLAMMKDFELFKKGYGKKIRNILSKKREDLDNTDIRIFDYSYTVGAGNNTRRINQTVFYVHSKALNLPELLIKPENFFHRIAEYFGMQDIEFETFPIFSKNYLVQGPHESLIREALNDDLLHYFTIEKNWSLEGLNYLLVFYRHGHRMHPELIESFYQQGLEIYNLLKKAQRKKD